MSTTSVSKSRKRWRSSDGSTRSSHARPFQLGITTLTRALTEATLSADDFHHASHLATGPSMAVTARTAAAAAGAQLQRPDRGPAGVDARPGRCAGPGRAHARALALRPLRRHRDPDDDGLRHRRMGSADDRDAHDRRRPSRPRRGARGRSRPPARAGRRRERRRRRTGLLRLGQRRRAPRGADRLAELPPAGLARLGPDPGAARAAPRARRVGDARRGALGRLLDARGRGRWAGAFPCWRRACS